MGIILGIGFIVKEIINSWEIVIIIIMIIKAIELMITMIIIMIYLFILVIIKAMKGFYFFEDHLQFFFLQFII